jgi:hypothetical protein
MADPGPLTRLTIVKCWFIYAGGHMLKKSAANVGGRVACERWSLYYLALMFNSRKLCWI